MIPNCGNSIGRSPYSFANQHAAPRVSDENHSASRTLTTNHPSVTGASPKPASSSLASSTRQILSVDAAAVSSAPAPHTPSDSWTAAVSSRALARRKNAFRCRERTDEAVGAQTSSTWAGQTCGSRAAEAPTRTCSRTVGRRVGRHWSTRSEQKCDTGAPTRVQPCAHTSWPTFPRRGAQHGWVPRSEPSGLGLRLRQEVAKRMARQPRRGVGAALNPRRALPVERAARVEVVNRELSRGRSAPAVRTLVRRVSGACGRSAPSGGRASRRGKWRRTSAPESRRASRSCGDRRSQPRCAHEPNGPFSKATRPTPIGAAVRPWSSGGAGAAAGVTRDGPESREDSRDDRVAVKAPHVGPRPRRVRSRRGRGLHGRLATSPSLSPSIVDKTETMKSIVSSSSPIQ